jgi:hypothetical protein
VSSSRIHYSQRQDTTRENEIAVLASIYKLALDSANRNAAGVTSTNGDDAERNLSDSAKHIIQGARQQLRFP